MIQPAAHDFAVPDDLSELDRWVLWRFEDARGRGTKVPYSVKGHKASTTDAKTWATFETAMPAWQANPRRYAGLGFVFVKGDGMVGIDLDDCLDAQGCLKDWARGVVGRFSDSYLEISPSGTGLKIWARGTLPHNVAGAPVGDGAIEMYDHARYFTVTGRVFSEAPLQIEDHATDIILLYQSLTRREEPYRRTLNGGKIRHGTQHNKLVSLCGTLRARGVCEEAIEACLQAVNEKQCEKPGLPEHITQIVRSSRKWLHI